MGHTRDALAHLCAVGSIDSRDADILQNALRLWQSVQGLLRLTLDRDVPLNDVDAMPEALKLALARAASEPDFTRLVLRMDDEARAAHAVHMRIIERTEE